MELLLASHSSYPRIGESAEFQSLRRTIAAWEKGEKNDSDLRAAEDRMTELALFEQAEAGLDVVTDGQIRWYDPVSHLAGKLQGIRINGLMRFFDTNFYFRQPVIESEIKRTQPLIVEEFLFAKAKAAQAVKPVLTGPYTLARLSIGHEDKSGELQRALEGYTAALGEEVAALAAAGATLIQVDEPALLKYPADFRHVEQGLAFLAARKGAAQLALALYFGDPASLYDRLQALPVDILNLDFTYSPRLVETIAAGGASKTLALGLVDGRNTRLEDPASVSRQLESMASSLGAGRAYLNPSCGLEYLPRDRALLKLKHLATIRKTFLGSRA
jgi:5-methyltetrahydropteroyltriglutamate--homocysteine methyltransferase